MRAATDPRLESCRVLWVTDRHRMRAPLVPRGESLYESGLPGLVLRERDLGDAPFADVARHLRAAADRTGRLLLVTNRLEVAKSTAHGVHLGAGGPSVAEARRVLGDGALIGVSLHRGDDPEHPARAEADYFFYSPVYATASKPGVPPLGLEALSAFCSATARPVFALGGITVCHAAACRGAGAHGVALTGALAGDEPAQEAWRPWRSLAADGAHGGPVLASGGVSHADPRTAGLLS